MGCMMFDVNERIDYDYRLILPQKSNNTKTSTKAAIRDHMTYNVHDGVNNTKTSTQGRKHTHKNTKYIFDF